MKSFAIACLAAASTYAMDLTESYDVVAYDEADFKDDFEADFNAQLESFDSIEDDLNAGNVVPLELINDLIIGLPSKATYAEELDESFEDDYESFEDDIFVNTSIPSHAPITEQIVEEIVEGFEQLALENDEAEYEAIAETQAIQKEDISNIIAEANEVATAIIFEAVEGNGELVLEDLNDVYVASADFITVANKVHDEEIAAISKQHAVTEVFIESALDDVVEEVYLAEVEGVEVEEVLE